MGFPHRPGPILAAALLGVLASCGGDDRPTAATDPPPVPFVEVPAEVLEGTQVVLQLGDQGTSAGRGGADQRRPAGCEPREPTVVEVSFAIAAGRLRDRATLILPGLRGRAQLTLNGEDLPEVNGGPGPTEVPLGGRLRVGTNDLRALVDSPAELPVLVTNGCVRHPTLGSDVHVILHPESWVRSVVLVGDGEKVGGAVRVRGQPAGSSVQLEAWLDGERIAWSGSADVGDDGEAQVPGTVWPGPRWRPGESGGETLVNVVAILLDGEGRVLDRASRRAGVRELLHVGGELELDGEIHRLMAIRADPETPPHEQLETWLGGGVNAVEIHGVAPSPSWLAEADELGLPVVVLPRCDGRLWVGIDPAQQRRVLESHTSILEAQDRELAWESAGHPSLALWACEGSRDVASALCKHLTAGDPRGTPAAGAQFSSWPLPGEGLREDLLPGEAAPRDFATDGWIVETMMEGKATTAAQAAASFVRACEAGALGGVIPPPAAMEPPNAWQKAWAGAARDLKAPSLDPEGRRASAKLKVRSLGPGQTVWLEVPGLTPVGTVAGAGGTALLGAWHRGAAAVVVDGNRREVDLSPVSWRGLQRTQDAQDLDWDVR